MLRSIGTKVLYALIWLACIAIGVFALIHAYEATRVLSAVLIPKMPGQEIRWQHLIVAVSHVLLILFALAWVVFSVVLLYVWWGEERTERQVWTLFAGAFLAELAVIGTSNLIIRQLPLLKLPSVL